MAKRDPLGVRLNATANKAPVARIVLAPMNLSVYTVVCAQAHAS